MLLVPLGLAAITSLHLGAQQLSCQGVCRTHCRLAQGVSAGPQPESRGTDSSNGGLPSVRTLSSLLGSVLSDLRGTGGAAALILAHHAPELPSQTSPALGSDLYISGPSTKQGRLGAPSVMSSGEAEPLGLELEGELCG